MQKFNKGDIVVGKVTGFADYGMFVIIDNVFPGLVHISQMSEGFVRDVEKFASIDEYILVKIIDVKEDKLMLSIKDINYKTKKCCIELSDPKLEVDPKEFDVLKNSLKSWLKEE